MSAKGATPQASRSPAEQRRLETTLRDLFEKRICFNEVLGLKVEALDSGSLGLGFDMRPDLIGHYQHERLHGGVISAALDTTGGAAILWAIACKHIDEDTEHVMHRFSRLGTVDLRIDYLRPGIGRHFLASATVTRLGGRIASTQMRLENDAGMLIATGSAAYVVS